jgi:hypothetical protein
MSMHELESMLWRYEYGRLHSARLELELRDEVQRLLDARAVQGSPFSATRWQATGFLIERDEALRAATAAVDTHRFRDALREIRRCSDALAEVDDFIDASASVDAAEQSVQTIDELAAADTLRRLPAVASLRQLVETMSFRMMEGRYRSAISLAALCKRMIAPLLLRRPLNDDEHAEAEARLADIMEVYEATSAVAADGEPDPRRDGSFDRIIDLLRENCTNLVMRLLIELEIGLASRRRFHLHFRQTLTPDETAALKALVAASSWDAAIDHHALQIMVREGATLALHAERAASAAANLDAVLTDET